MHVSCALPDVLLCFLLCFCSGALPSHVALTEPKNAKISSACWQWRQHKAHLASACSNANTRTHTHPLHVCVCEDVFSQSETATKCIYVQYAHTGSMHAEQDSASCLRCYCVPHILEEEMETRLCTDSILIWFSWLTFGQTERQTATHLRFRYWLECARPIDGLTQNRNSTSCVYDVTLVKSRVQHQDSERSKPVCIYNTWQNKCKSQHTAIILPNHIKLL